MGKFVLAAARRDAEDSRHGAGDSGGGSHHLQMVDYIYPEPCSQVTKKLIGDCACARGSSAETVWMMGSHQGSSPAGV
jgi:hypothetical protein